MRKIILLGIIGIVAAMATSCTENQRARKWGGTEVIELESDKKLVNVTWKGDQLWILTKKMGADEVAESYSFKEKSSYGVMEGTLIIKESKENKVDKVVKNHSFKEENLLWSNGKNSNIN